MSPGPAGCVLANRLTENPKWNVLIIEAGTLETFIEQVPLFAPYGKIILEKLFRI